MGHMLKELMSTIMRVVFGHNAVDNTSDWYVARQKTKQSRAELEQAAHDAWQDTES